tara:strand:- start:728 stop:1942 length:1215 start_codon:yes stop_codon:yes gene_type:complete
MLMKMLKKYSEWPPLFAAYTHAVLKDKGHEVEYKNTLPENFDEFDFFIVVTSIVCCETEIEVIKKLKNKNKKIFAIGPFATNISNIFVKAGATVIHGEPEFYFLGNQNFDEDLKKDVVYFENKHNIDDLPYPKWEQLQKNEKKINIKLYGNYKSIPIIATRGCPFSCARYCVYPLQQGNKVRQRNVKKIVDEIEYWKSKHKVNMFIFRDPVFSINKKHTAEFCNEIIKRNLRIKFVIETHLKILDSKLILLLKKAGLKAVKVGIESSDPNVLKKESRFTVEKDEQLQKIRELEKNSLQISSMFIIGFPSDNKETINNTINYAKYLNTTYAQFSVWTPYPGTPVFSDYKNDIIVKKYEEFDQYRLVYKHNKFDETQIRYYLDKAYSKYYSRFSWVLKYFKSFITA